MSVTFWLFLLSTQDTMDTQLWMPTTLALSANVTAEGPHQPFATMLMVSANAKTMWLA